MAGVGPGCIKLESGTFSRGWENNVLLHLGPVGEPGRPLRQGVDETSGGTDTETFLFWGNADLELTSPHAWLRGRPFAVGSEKLGTKRKRDSSLCRLLPDDHGAPSTTKRGLSISCNKRARSRECFQVSPASVPGSLHCPAVLNGGGGEVVAGTRHLKNSHSINSTTPGTGPSGRNVLTSHSSVQAFTVLI